MYPINIFRGLIIIVCAAMTFTSFNLGMDYVNFNTGWHPYIAFPITVLSTAIGLILYYWDDIRRYLMGE